MLGGGGDQGGIGLILGITWLMLIPQEAGGNDTVLVTPFPTLVTPFPTLVTPFPTPLVGGGRHHKCVGLI